MQFADQFGGLDVDGILILEDADLAAKDEVELVDVLWQIGQQEGGLGAGVEIVELKGAEIADETLARAFAFGQGEDVAGGLNGGADEVSAEGFLLDQDDAGPEQINETLRAGEFLDGLFVDRHIAAADAEHGEEGVPEGVGIAAFIAVTGVIGGKHGGAGAQIVEGKAHAPVVAGIFRFGKMAGAEGLEPSTYGFGDRRSTS